MSAAFLTKTVPAPTFAGARELVPDHELMRERCSALDARAGVTISRLKLRLDGPSCALYCPHGTGIDVEMGYRVQADPATTDPDVHVLPSIEVASTVYTGSYDNFAAVGQLHVALREWSPAAVRH